MDCSKALDYNTSLAKPMTRNLATDTTSRGIFGIQCDDCQVYHRALPNGTCQPCPNMYLGHLMSVTHRKYYYYYIQQIGMIHETIY